MATRKKQTSEAAVRDGCKGAWVNPFHHNRTLHGHTTHDAFHAKFVELDVPLAIHPTFTPHDKPAEGIFDWPREAVILSGSLWLRNIVQQAFVSYIALGTLDRFPELRLGIL